MRVEASPRGKGPARALSGHGLVHRKCPLSGVKRTSRGETVTSAFNPKRTSTPIAPAGHRITVSWSLGNPVDFYRTAFELLCAGGPGASGAAARGVFAASAPLVTPFVPSCAALVTPFVASCAPLMTPLHPARLCLVI